MRSGPARLRGDLMRYDPRHDEASASARKRALAHLLRAHPNDLTPTDGLRMSLLGANVDLIIRLGTRWYIQRLLDRWPRFVAAFLRRRLAMDPQKQSCRQRPARKKAGPRARGARTAPIGKAGRV